jgi:uncharacterized protein
MATHGTRTERRLLEFMAGLDIIDCHEHLPPEKVRTDQPQDVFTLVSHYCRHDLFSAGMDRETYCGMNVWGVSRPTYESLFNPALPLAQRWALFEPWWEAIRHGSYARAAILTAKLVYGVDRIDASTCHELSARIAAENTPGIYTRMLCQRCRILAALTQCARMDVDRPLVPIMPAAVLADIAGRDALEKLAAGLGAEVPADLDAYLALVRRQLVAWAAAGMVGLKFMSRAYAAPDAKGADEAFRRLWRGQAPTPDRRSCLHSHLTHALLDLCGELGLVAAVHAGIWGDFREIDCTHMLALAPAHPRTDFDLYHLGMPSVREAIVVAKNLPNVWLNLCWTHIVSQVQSRSGIDELLDQVPVTKVLAFGGDYGRPVEKVVGHLHMAREDYARVFGERIDRGLLDTGDAEAILTLWFRQNPLRLYRRLKLPGAAAA